MNLFSDQGQLVQQDMCLMDTQAALLQRYTSGVINSFRTVRFNYQQRVRTLHDLSSARGWIVHRAH